MGKLAPILLLSATTFYSSYTQASYPETFGAAPQNSALGNQCSDNFNDASNNYYNPAMLAFAKGTHFHIGSSVADSKFKEINNVTTQNPVSDGPSASQVSSIDTDYSPVLSGSIHTTFNIMNSQNHRLGLSIHTPLTYILTADTGAAFQTEYVMHRSRYKRTNIHLNYIRRWNSEHAFSFGFHSGIQASADMNTQVSMNGNTSGGSSSSMKTKAIPSLGAVLSWIMNLKSKSKIYFTYQQEMKSNLKTMVTGENGNPPLPFDIEISSMVFYDPHIFRLGMIVPGQSVTMFGSLEYQVWKNYETPTFRIAKRSGTILSSDPLEQPKIRNIVVPKIGIQIHTFDKLNMGLGAFYRQTPLESDYSGAGNSVDNDTYGLSTGMSYKTKAWGYNMTPSFAVQYQRMLGQDVTKSDNDEAGNAGNKIGAPGYSIGGRIYMVSVGLDLEF